MVAHAADLSGVSDIQGDIGAGYGHLYRGDVGAYGSGLHRVFQRIGGFSGTTLVGSAVFPYFLRCSQGIDALCGWRGGGCHPVGQEPDDPLCLGLGATSAVLMLVFKDTITGLAAGVRLTSNDMLHKGDWITVKSVDANGIVEDMSLTTVKVRNFDNTIVTISPITLVNGSFQNWIGMQKSGGRRVKRVVYFDFRSVRLVDETLKRNLLAKHFATEDSFKLKASLQKAIDKDIQEGKDIEDLKNPAALAPTNLQLYRKFMEKYLRQRPEVNTDLTLMVRHMEATQCGLPIEFYFFIKDKVWVNYEHILADIMEHAYALANEFGLKIYEQYPEQ